MENSNSFRKIIRKILLYTSIGSKLVKKRFDFYNRFNQLQPSSKHEVIRQYANRFHLNVLIETGTYLGDTLFATLDIFKVLYSIELSQELFAKAKERFATTVDKVIIKQGDSGNVLPEILKSIKEPCLFWLDAHYSRGVTAKGHLETPIIQELKIILRHPIKNHIILIDDARCFNGKNDYPTIRELEQLLIKEKTYRPLFLTDDIIRIMPPVNAFNWFLGKIKIRINNGGFRF